MIAALGRLAGTGVLVKGGAVLERLAGVKAFAFDKTGTLTEGRLELGDVVPHGTSETELLRLAAAAEQGSEHPIGRLIVAAASTRGLTTPAADSFGATPAGVWPRPSMVLRSLSALADSSRTRACRSHRPRTPLLPEWTRADKPRCSWRATTWLSAQLARRPHPARRG